MGFSPLEPKDKTGFGYVVWLILGGKDANYAQVAKKLKINKASLSEILHGKETISQKALVQKKWVKIFMTHRSENWKKYSKDFEKHVAVLPKRVGKIAMPPREQDRFALVLWHIIGGDDADIPKALKHLQIDRSSLSEIFRGHRKISQKTVVEKKWREVLAKHYSKKWKKYSADFDKHATSLPRRAGVSTREPADKESLGHALWLILGGKEAEIVDAAPRLGIAPGTLTDTLHGKRKISRQMIRKWKKILIVCYPHGWKKYVRIFEQRAARLP